MRFDNASTQASGDGSVPLRACLLGPVRISVGDRRIVDQDWPRRSARSLVLLLLATPGHQLTRERIIDALWPETSADAGMNALRVALHAARRALEPNLSAGAVSAFLKSKGDAITLQSDGGIWTDVDQFEAAIASLPPVADAQRTGMLQEAVELYGGQLLGNELDVDWSLARRERLHRAWRNAVLELSQLDNTRGSLDYVSYVERLLNVDPADEAAHRALMKAYFAAGQRDQALRQYGRCVEALQEELDVEPSEETIALAAEIRAAVATSVPVILPIRERIDILPVPPNPLIGRVRELESLGDLLLNPDVRLVTLTGPGGIGKTRLALEAVRNVAGDFAAGSCFVDLSTISEPGLVIPTIARTIGLEEIPGVTGLQLLVQSVADSELLLVLDNLEQVIDAADDIAITLATCPGLTILATSRQPLRIRAERIIATPPLAVPPVSLPGKRDQRTGRLGDKYDAVTLFVERARAAQPGFEVTDANWASIAAVCARLDGLPLAIELAAARSRHLNPDAMLEQLVPRLPMLTGGARDLPARQRTLRDAIAWSYDLLEDAEKELFRNLSVFPGEFGIEAIQGIVGTPENDPRQIAESVWDLADKNLLQRQDGQSDGAVRYKMLETIREFGLEHLALNGNEATVRSKHATWFVKLAENAEPHLHGPDQIAWLQRLEQEHDNFRSALEWACEYPDAEMAQRLSGALAEFWRVNGYLGEGRAWLERALALAQDVPSDARALATRGSGLLAQAQGDSEIAVARLSRALEDWRAIGDKRRTGQTLGLLADIARARGEYTRSIDLNEQALALFEEIGFEPGVADTLNQLGIIASDRSEYNHAEVLFQRSSEIFARLGDRHGSARVLNNLGSLSFWQEHYREAASFYERSLHLWRALGHRPHTALVLANLGESLRAEGDLEQAMAITQEGLDVSREVGDKRSEATALFILGSLIQHHEYDLAAIGPLVSALRLYQQVGDRLGMAWCLEALAGAATARAHPETGAQFLGAAEALRETLEIALKPAELAAYQRHLNATEAAFGSAEEFEVARNMGRELPLADVMKLAAELEFGSD